MADWLVLIVVAVAAGIAGALQAQFMGLVDKGMGTLESVFITYVSGGLVIMLWMALQRGGNLAAWRSVPGYALTTGVLGLIIVGAIGYSMPRLGLVTGLTLFVAAQYIVAAVIDHYALFGAVVRPLDPPRLVGMGIMLIGVWLIVR